LIAREDSFGYRLKILQAGNDQAIGMKLARGLEEGDLNFVGAGALADPEQFEERAFGKLALHVVDGGAQDFRRERGTAWQRGFRGGGLAARRW
jgi:hypothetical protein